MYTLDTSAISALHRNYYPERFPSLWRNLDGMLAAGKFTSTREVLNELEDRGGEAYEWAKRNSGLFVTPDAKEGAIVASIFRVKHFQANIERQKLLRGGRGADPFLVARAHATGTCLVTMEQFRENAAKIPNICKHFGVVCVDLNGFMEREGWAF